MHEVHIAQNLIDEAKKQGDVYAIKVEVGEVAHITKPELEPILNDITDWDITILEIPAECKCTCGFEGSPKILERGHDICVYECPECGNNPEITKGGDIKLTEVHIT